MAATASLPYLYTVDLLMIRFVFSSSLLALLSLLLGGSAGLEASQQLFSEHSLASFFTEEGSRQIYVATATEFNENTVYIEETSESEEDTRSDAEPGLSNAEGLLQQPQMLFGPGCQALAHSASLHIKRRLFVLYHQLKLDIA